MLNIIATFMVAVLVTAAFDPKYRYNEHQKWMPDLLDWLFMLLMGGFITWRIFV